MIAFVRKKLIILKTAWTNRSYAKYEFRYCNFEGSSSEVQMYLHKMHRVSEHHFYLIGVLVESNAPCVFRLDRIRGKIKDLRALKVHRNKSFLFKYSRR